MDGQKCECLRIIPSFSTASIIQANIDVLFSNVEVKSEASLVNMRQWDRKNGNAASQAIGGYLLEDALFPEQFLSISIGV